METHTYNAEPFWHKYIGLIYMIILAAAFVQLNIQKPLYAVLSIDTANRASHIVLLLWLLAPALSWFLAIRQLIRQRSFTRTEQGLWVFSALLLLHACITMVYYGLTPAAISFLAWGAWLPIYFISTKDSSFRWLNFIVFILIIGGILQAIPVLYEFFADEIVFRRSTVGVTTRLYGINQSVSILGTQLAIGCIACIYWFIETSRISRLFPAIVFCILCFSLIATTSRGPLLFLAMILVSFLIVSFIPQRKSLRLLGISTIFLTLFASTFGLFHLLDISVTNKAAMRNTASYFGKISYESSPTSEKTATTQIDDLNPPLSDELSYLKSSSEEISYQNSPPSTKTATTQADDLNPPLSDKLSYLKSPSEEISYQNSPPSTKTAPAQADDLNPPLSDKLSYLKSSMSLSDKGNASRIDIFFYAYTHFTDDFFSMMFGRGAGKLSQLSYYIGQHEMATESSIIKLFLELGILGGMLAISVIVSVIIFAIKPLHKINIKIIPFLGMAALIFMESAIHEILKSWLMSLYLWLIISGITIIANNKTDEKNRL